MLEKFSRQALKIIDNAKNICFRLKQKVIGTEHILLAMFQMSDSICHFLLNERLITYDDLIRELGQLVILRQPKETKEVIYTKKFQEISERAEQISIKCGSNHVYDEHIFYAILTDDNNVAKTILVNLGIKLDELVEDLDEIYNMSQETTDDPDLPSFLNNLSKIQSPHPYIPRGNHIQRIMTILKKKQKNNPLLIGSAGVGKTAVVEGLARLLSEETVYRLDLGGVIAGTKYRGELEEKIIQAMDYIKKEKAIVFIDEIHNIVGAGSNDGSLDIANILKPYLARNDIRCIGATTLDEYYQFIEKDKALLRRFQNVFIAEPSIEETKEILTKIKSNYELHHGVIYSDSDIDYVIELTHKYLPTRTFPDKAIDLLDEVGAYITICDVKKPNIKLVSNQVIFNMCGIEVKTADDLSKHTYNYPQLLPSYLSFVNNLPQPNLCTVRISEDFSLDDLKEDLEFVFSFREEAYLEIDLDCYFEPSMLSSLIGSSKGYVGYESGGILSEHIIKYPFSVIHLKNFEKAHLVIQNFLKKVLTTPFFIDNKSRKVNTQNTLFLIGGFIAQKTSVGLVHSNKEKVEFVKIMI